MGKTLEHDNERVDPETEGQKTAAWLKKEVCSDDSLSHRDQQEDDAIADEYFILFG